MMTGELRFAFSLAKELGYINPYKMLEEVPAMVLTQWQAFSKIEAAEMNSASQSRQSLQGLKGR